jgi:hypothetical protein
MGGSRSRKSSVVIEAMEDRRLLSTSLGAGAPFAATSATIAAPSARTYGLTLHLQSNQSFSGYLGDVVGAQVNPKTNNISASINWGDHSQAGEGVVTVGASGHIDVSGMHAYSTPSDYAITITVFAGPRPSSGQPAPAKALLGTIKSQAVVAGTSVAAVEIAETATVPFTTTVGSFQFAAPAQGLSATINWGDGISTAATLKPGGSTGLVRFDVDGAHTYAKPGEYAIRVVVSQKVGSANNQVASIASKAVITSVITGTYVVAASNPDAGATYQFTGTGVTGNLPLTFTGSVTLPGFVASGSAAGKLTLRTSEGSVTFAVTGPVEKGFGPFPTTLKFVVSGGSGTFAGSTGSGTIAVSLNTSEKTFAFTLEDVTAVAL